MESEDTTRNALRPAVLPFESVGRPIRVGVINNPLSWRNSHKNTLQSVISILSGHGHVPHHEADRPEDIQEATRALLEVESELIIVNGGDGTVQAVLTGLFTNPTEKMPLLAILPGGTTNMIAGDVGAGRDPLAVLQGLLSSARSGRLKGAMAERAVFRAEVAAGADPIFAMFFGAGAVYHGIRFCRSRIETMGVRGETGPGLALAVVIAKVLFGQGGALFPPLHLQGRIDGKPIASHPLLGMLVSTLDRLFLGLRPFWGAEEAPIRYTSFWYKPKHAFRAVLPVMRGKPNRFVRPDLGYTSRNVHELVLELDSGFTLDGELFTPEPGSPVVLRGGYSAFFLRPQSG